MKPQERKMFFIHNFVPRTESKEAVTNYDHYNDRINRSLKLSISQIYPKIGCDPNFKFKFMKIAFHKNSHIKTKRHNTKTSKSVNKLSSYFTKITSVVMNVCTRIELAVKSTSRHSRLPWVGRTHRRVLVSTWAQTHWQFPVERERRGTRTFKVHDSYNTWIAFVLWLVGVRKCSVLLTRPDEMMPDYEAATSPCRFYETAAYAVCWSTMRD